MLLETSPNYHCPPSAASLNMIPLKTFALCFSQIASKTKTKFLLLSDPQPSLSVLQTQLLLYRSFTSKPTSEPHHNSTVDYFINSCGLFPEGAIIASKRFKLLNQERADSVLALFRNHGFSQTQIARVVRSYPEVIKVDLDKTLLPKLEYFTSLGVSKEDIAKAVAGNPKLLGLSLEKRLKPTIDFLRRTCLLPDKHVATVFKRNSRIFLQGHCKNVVPNIAALRESGVSPSCISMLVPHNTQVMMVNHEKFAVALREVKEMGFIVNTTPFVRALMVLSGKDSMSRLKKTRQIYMNRWGWSEGDVSAAFRKYPLCMFVSEKKIMRVMCFLVNEFGMDSGLIARSPSLLGHSLEKKIIPRCAVVKVLLLKGLIYKKFSLNTMLTLPEVQFLEKFVTKFVAEVPQLLSVYQGNVYGDIQKA